MMLALLMKVGVKVIALDFIVLLSQPMQITMVVKQITREIISLMKAFFTLINGVQNSYSKRK